MSDETVKRPRARMDTDALAEQMLQDTVAETVAAEEPKKAEDSRTPVERWHAAIEKAGLTHDQALAIIDAQIDPGYWTDECRLWNGRVRVTFRSRTGAHRNMLIRELDSLQNPSSMVIGQTVARINLLNSIHSYHDRKRNVTFEYAAKDTSPEDADTMLQRRLTFINRELPESILDMLYVKLAEFDAKVAAALSEGAIEGF